MHLGTNCCHMAKVLIPKIRTRRTLFQFFLPTNPWQQRASLDSVFCRANRVEEKKYRLIFIQGVFHPQFFSILQINKLRLGYLS